MEYTEKKLPKGFLYMLNKKDINEINDLVNKCIESVYLSRTSYSETKMAGVVWEKSKTVVYIKTKKNESELFVHIELFGIKFSNFENQEIYLAQKKRVKLEVIEKIKNNIEANQKNNPITEFQFVSVELKK